MSAKRRHEYAIQGPDGQIVGTMKHDDPIVVRDWLDALDVEYPDHRFNMVARTVIEGEWVTTPRVPRVGER